MAEPTDTQTANKTGQRLMAVYTKDPILKLNGSKAIHLKAGWDQKKPCILRPDQKTAYCNKKPTSLPFPQARHNDSLCADCLLKLIEEEGNKKTV